MNRLKWWGIWDCQTLSKTRKRIRERHCPSVGERSKAWAFLISRFVRLSNIRFVWFADWSRRFWISNWNTIVSSSCKFKFLERRSFKIGWRLQCTVITESVTLFEQSRMVKLDSQHERLWIPIVWKRLECATEVFNWMLASSHGLQSTHRRVLIRATRSASKRYTQ